MPSPTQFLELWEVVNECTIQEKNVYKLTRTQRPSHILTYYLVVVGHLPSSPHLLDHEVPEVNL